MLKHSVIFLSYIKKQMKEAKFIGVSNGRAGRKFRWECPYCRKNKAPECRFNLSPKKINVEHKCRFCKRKLFLKYFKR